MTQNTKPTPDTIAVICDIDGTLAHMVNRDPHDPTKYLDDEKRLKEYEL